PERARNLASAGHNYGWSQRGVHLQHYFAGRGLMAKKPASLTSDLLARKGEAGPSIVEPAARVTLTPGRQPDLSGVSATEGPSPELYTSPATGRPEDMHGMDEEERPRPPEPEIIYTPEDEEGGGRTRLIVGAFIGLALLGGVLVALSLN